jgi:hypothetical protein
MMPSTECTVGYLDRGPNASEREERANSKQIESYHDFVLKISDGAIMTLCDDYRGFPRR